jgi:hypothetical protein
MITTQPLRTNLLGDHKAEDDKNLLENFVETPEYRSIIESKDSCVVVGRRGTGKSAIFIKLQNQWLQGGKQNHIVAIAPEDNQTIYFRSLCKEFITTYNFIRPVSRYLWKYGILLELLTKISHDYKSKSLIESDPALHEHLKKWKSTDSPFLLKITAIAKPLLKNKDIEEIIGELPSLLEIRMLENKISHIFSQVKNNSLVLIDKLDEGYENDLAGAAIISGIIACVSEFNKQYENLRIVVFLRDNILRSLKLYDPDYTRNIEGEVLTLHWDTYRLLNLSSKRLKTTFNLNVEKDQRIWDRCTANTGGDNEIQGIDGFKKCLQFTLYRPRDLLSLLNKAFYFARTENRDVITYADIERTANEISKNRFDDLIKEYRQIFPSIPYATSIFSQGNPEMTYGEAIQLLDSVNSNNDGAALEEIKIIQSDGIVRSLYSVGFLGVHDEHSNTFIFCHDGKAPNRDFQPDEKILIHPCYWIALNLSKSALKSEEMEQINDEYEIKVESISPELRNQKIGALISEVSSISLGNSDSRSFEEWVFKSIQIVFARHLSNIEKHPNGNSTQRRDVIGTNTLSSKLWQSISHHYQVRQVIFEVKNYQNIGRDEYRQMNSYLHNSYGKLGFIVTRDDEPDLKKGGELDWVRETYTSHGKLIIRLSYKFLIKMLSKLRNPEKHDVVDDALGNILDKYERTYLSLPSTTTARKSR